MELPKTYNPKEVEDKIYEKWEGSGFFNPDNLEHASDRYWNAPVFSVAMPPPNVTGVLHLGHALENALMDTEIRYQRMLGKKTLLVPGTDHAAIATQNVVEREIWEKEKKTRHDLGREELLRRIDKFIGQTQGRIQQQIRKMGTSCDWSREKYTLSPELSLAVRTIFKRLYDAGLIYRGERIVNWCPRCGTTLADDEVEYRETDGKLYHIRYPFPKAKGSIEIATTRPETMLADTAVAVHPQDARYKKFIGQTVILPLINRELLIIADEAVDRKFGTGALKITPGHDPLDFEIGQRHKLEIISLLTEEGKIDQKEAYDHGFEEYAGLTVSEGREKIVKDLETNGFLQKTEDLKHNIGYCYRCGTVVEPMISKQWFVSVSSKFKIQNSKFREELKLNEEVSLKEVALAAVKSGAIKITPKRFEKTFFQWMENLRDWNISRQIWFGHQIPVWYCGDCGETIVSTNTPSQCPACGNRNLTQDPDTLDTWFSSSLWTFSTLGWPNQTEDLRLYHPTSWMQMGYEILFLWMARMIYMSTFALNQIPFREVYFHGMLRDKEGKKFSKSAKIGLDPLEIIKKYGTDALRLSLIAGISPGNDSRFYEEKVEHYKNFVNKFWNVSRFILEQIKDSRSQIKDLKSKTVADEWILSRLAELIKQNNVNMEKYEFSQSVENLYEFTWHELADWYLEISKMALNRHPRGGGDPTATRAILQHILQTLLKLWHPFIPFVTEHIWLQISDDFLMIQEYPLPPKLQTANYKLQAGFPKLQSLITGLRNLRSEYRQDPAQIYACYLELSKNLSWIQDQAAVIEKLARVKINFASMPSDKKMPYFIWQDTKVYLVIPDFDPKKEKALTEKELKETSGLIERLSAQLEKKDFLKKAPAEVVEKLKTDYQTTKLRAEKLAGKIRSLK
ncbi:MAG: valine--tRNA ligase [Candidatus Doudnabacteria bacterium]|nr:valine--tRNA ligase [Candidatus Doudnabacteria bacterium]